MDKNFVKRHWVRGKLAKDSKAQEEPKQPGVHGARIRGKRAQRAPDLIRGDLLFFEAGVSRGRSSRWDNDHPGRLVKTSHRAKGQTGKKLSRKAKGDGEVAEICGEQIGRGSSTEGAR
jgi:hypothetical protein